MEVLTLESLDKLYDYARKEPSDMRIVDDFDDLFNELHLTMAPVDYDIDVSIPGLLIPDGSNESKLSTDSKNIDFVYRALSNLSAAEATDERLWATLTLIHHSDYARARWGVPEGDAASGHILTHWLCKSGVRSRIRDNAISRLWWMGRVVDQLPGWNVEDVSAILFNNSDYRASIVERNTSVSAANVVSAIIAITKEAFAADIKFDRNSFRSFMKKVNFLAGRTNLAALSDLQTIDLLKPYYYEAYEKKIGGRRSLLNTLLGR